MLLTYVILTFRSVGLGSYLCTHVCHSYPGLIFCVNALRISLSTFFESLRVSLSQCSRLVPLSLRLSVYDKCLPTTGTCPQLFLCVWDGESFYDSRLAPGFCRSPRPWDSPFSCSTDWQHNSSLPYQPRLFFANFVSSMSTSSLLRQPRLVHVNLVSPKPTSSRLCQPRLAYVNLVSSCRSATVLSFFILYAFLLRQIYFRFICFVNFL